MFQGPAGQSFAEAAGLGGEQERIFHGVRPFREGDRLRDLDHKSWARWNQPIVREFAATPPRGIALCVETCCDDLLERSLLEPMIRLAAGVADNLCRGKGLARLVVDGLVVPIRCDDPALVRSVFASLPRCGWGKWPDSTRSPLWTDPSGCVLRIGVSVARSRSRTSGTEKRIAVVDRRRVHGEDLDLAHVEAATIQTGEVLL